MTSDNSLSLALRSASQGLIDQHSLRDRDVLIGQLVTCAVTLVPTAEGAGISRTEGDAMRTSHATTPLIEELDRLQNQLGEGPCVSAADMPPESGVFYAHDLEGPDADRWPTFAARAVERGMRSLLSVSLIGEAGGRRSVLNLYSGVPEAFDVNAITTASLFANHAGALLYGADNAAHLGLALASRDVIGQAKGILMERFGVTNGEAFEMLVKSSQDTNTKLVEVATWLSTDVEDRAHASEI